MKQELRIRKLTGRCANGYEGGKGKLYHAVPIGSSVAICGATFGKRSAGWSEWDGETVTCEKCLKKIEAKP